MIRETIFTKIKIVKKVEKCINFLSNLSLDFEFEERERERINVNNLFVM